MTIIKLTIGLEIDLSVKTEGHHREVEGVDLDKVLVERSHDYRRENYRGKNYRNMSGNRGNFRDDYRWQNGRIILAETEVGQEKDPLHIMLNEMTGAVVV